MGTPPPGGAPGGVPGLQSSSPAADHLLVVVGVRAVLLQAKPGVCFPHGGQCSASAFMHMCGRASGGAFLCMVHDVGTCVATWLQRLAQSRRARATPTMPARHRLQSKRSLRAHAILRSSTRLQKRRAALRSLSVRAGALDLAIAKVQVRHVSGAVLKKMPWALACRSHGV